MGLAMAVVALLVLLAGDVRADGPCCSGDFSGGGGGYYSHGYGCPGHYSTVYRDATSRSRSTSGRQAYIYGSGAGYGVGVWTPADSWGNTSTSESTSAGGPTYSGAWSSDGGWGFNWRSGGTGFSFRGR